MQALSPRVAGSGPHRGAASKGYPDRLGGTLPQQRTVAVFAYTGAVTIAALLCVAGSVAALPDRVSQAGGAFALIAVLAVVVDLRPFVAATRGNVATVFPSIAFTFALLLGWGLAAAVAVQSASVVVSSIRLRRAGWRVVFDASRYGLAFAAAAAVLRLFGVPVLTPGTHLDLVGVAGIAIAAFTWFVVDDLLVASAVWLRSGEGWWHAVTGALTQEALSALGLLALGPLVVAASSVSAGLIPFMLIPLYGVSMWGRSVEAEWRKSHLDELTGLPNRRALLSELRAQIRGHAQRYGRRGGDPRRIALVLLDVDQFRRVNEALGHLVGDRLLVAVANRLRECIGADGVVARLGGDEFAVLAPRLAGASAAGVLAQRVFDALVEPVRLDTLPLDVTAAIGVAVYPEHGADNTTLLRHAEVAMYDARDRGATFAVYTSESDQHSPQRLELLADLRRTLELGRTDELVLHYQPQVDLTGGNVVGVEALLRWRHPVLGLIPPDHVIKVVEHTAVMRTLTHRVLADAITQLGRWRAHGLTLRASVNVSVRDLHRPELVEQIEGMLTDADVPPNQLQLEITEGALMADPRRVLVTLHRLDRLGVALSLDDFGTGYSSLQHLRRLPLAEVKIDKSFVLGMTTDPDDAAVVGSIIDLARALGLRVVAEGVEEDRTRALLRNKGCEVAQGWFYARPMPAEDLVTWLAHYRPSP